MKKLLGIPFLGLCSALLGADPICFRWSGQGSCLSASQVRAQGFRYVRFQPQRLSQQGGVAQWWLQAYRGVEPEMHYPYSLRAEWPRGAAESEVGPYLDEVCREVTAAGMGCLRNFMTGRWLLHDAAHPLSGVPFRFREDNDDGGRFSYHLRCGRDLPEGTQAITYECSGEFASRSTEQYRNESFVVRIRNECRQIDSAPATENPPRACPAVPLSALPFTIAQFRVANEVRIHGGPHLIPYYQGDSGD